MTAVAAVAIIHGEQAATVVRARGSVEAPSWPPARRQRSRRMQQVVVVEDKRREREKGEQCWSFFKRR